MFFVNHFWVSRRTRAFQREKGVEEAIKQLGDGKEGNEEISWEMNDKLGGRREDRDEPIVLIGGYKTFIGTRANWRGQRLTGRRSTEMIQWKQIPPVFILWLPGYQS